MAEEEKLPGWMILNSQGVEQLRARIPQALMEDYSLDGTTTPPGMNSKSVFDTDDGLRIVMSFDKVEPDKDAFLHVSVSVTNTPVGNKLIESCEEFASVNQVDINELIISFIFQKLVELFRPDDMKLSVYMQTKIAIHFKGLSRSEYEEIRKIAGNA